jgi:hypothetical protein
MDYYEIFKRLNELKIDYLITGGLAVNLYGIPRMTYDIDIMVKLDKKNISKIINELLKWGYKLKIPINPLELTNLRTLKKLIKEKNIRALNFYNEKEVLTEIDVIIWSPIPYEKLKLNSTYFKIFDEKIPVIGIKDLIFIKSRTKRKQDKIDVENLKKVLSYERKRI